MPEVSIIVPIYNAEKTLDRCIDSILKQSYADFELILVDDGSTDDSLKICRRYAMLDKRIHLLRQDNTGVAAARNAGMETAVGKYLLFSDSDDYAALDWCEALLQAIRIKEDVWIVSNAYKVHFSGECRVIDDLKHHPKSETYCDIFLKYLSPYLWNKIYNARIIRENKICFRPDVELGEDAVFNTEYYKYCSSVSYIPEPLY